MHMIEDSRPGLLANYEIVRLGPVRPGRANPDKQSWPEHGPARLTPLVYSVHLYKYSNRSSSVLSGACCSQDSTATCSRCVRRAPRSRHTRACRRSAWRRPGATTSSSPSSSRTSSSTWVPMRVPVFVRVRVASEQRVESAQYSKFTYTSYTST